MRTACSGTWGRSVGRDDAEGADGEGRADLLGLSREGPGSAWMPVLLCHRLPRPCNAPYPCFFTHEGSLDRELYGLSDEPAIILFRPQGEEFARLEGPNATCENLEELVRLFEAESRILDSADCGPERSCSDLVKLMLAQRRLSAAIIAWKGLTRHGDPSTLCFLALRTADLALEMNRHEEAIPLLEHVACESEDQSQRVDALSRLAQFRLNLGS